MTVVNSILDARYAWSAMRSMAHPAWLWPSGTQIGGGFYDTATGGATSVVGPITGAGPWTANAGGLLIDSGTVGASAPFAFSPTNGFASVGGWSGAQWELWNYFENGTATLLVASGPAAFGSSPGQDFFGRTPFGAGPGGTTVPLFLYQRSITEPDFLDLPTGRTIAFQNTEPPVGNDVYEGSFINEGDVDLLSVGGGDGGGVLVRTSIPAAGIYIQSSVISGFSGSLPVELPTDTTATQFPYPTGSLTTIYTTQADYAVGPPVGVPFPAILRAAGTGEPTAGFDFVIAGVPQITFGGVTSDAAAGILPPIPGGCHTTNCGPGVVITSCSAAVLLPPLVSPATPFKFGDQLVALRVSADQKSIWANPMTMCYTIGDPAHTIPNLLVGDNVLWQQAGPGEFFGPIDGGWLPAPVNRGAVWFVVGNAPTASGQIAFSFLPRLTYPTCGIGCSSLLTAGWRQVHIIG